MSLLNQKIKCDNGTLVYYFKREYSFYNRFYIIKLYFKEGINVLQYKKCIYTSFSSKQWTNISKIKRRLDKLGYQKSNRTYSVYKSIYALNTDNKSKDVIDIAFSRCSTFTMCEIHII